MSNKEAANLTDLRNELIEEAIAASARGAIIITHQYNIDLMVLTLKHTECPMIRNRCKYTITNLEHQCEALHRHCPSVDELPGEIYSHLQRRGAMPMVHIQQRFPAMHPDQIRAAVRQGIKDGDIRSINCQRGRNTGSGTWSVIYGAVVADRVVGLPQKQKAGKPAGITHPSPVRDAIMEYARTHPGQEFWINDLDGFRSDIDLARSSLSYQLNKLVQQGVLERTIRRCGSGKCRYYYALKREAAAA